MAPLVSLSRKHNGALKDTRLFMWFTGNQRTTPLPESYFSSKDVLWWILLNYLDIVLNDNLIYLFFRNKIKRNFINDKLQSLGNGPSLQYY